MKGLIAGAVATLALAGAADAQPSVQPQHTTQMARTPSLRCSVTSGGPSFVFGRGAIDMTYGGGVSCKGGIGTKVLKVWVQVAGSGANRGVYFDVRGSQRTSVSGANPVRINVGREVFLGHAYRVVAFATVSFPNGFAGCSLHKPPACVEQTIGSSIGPTIAP